MAMNVSEMELLSIVFVLLSPFFVVSVDANGLSSRSFQGFYNLQEIQCSGENLPPDSDLLGIVLYSVKPSLLLAAANLRKQECSTSSSYIACHLDTADTRKSKVKALVDDLTEGQSRVFGCNISAFVDGTRMTSFSWFITVHHISEYTTSF
ncbi:hypothetical protein V1264_016813 [Littorina saxatilis]|uniref:Uncharacterized protein n=1 Tax=Littorina saxatilis TaxID=31220 RepID=A0AAN9BHR2_9CAEN